VYPADDLADTVHVAAVHGGEVVGVATVFPEELDGAPAWRLRGMAVEQSRRGEGVGSLLLAEVCELVRRRGATVLWCNARRTALEFYRAHGFTVGGDEFLAAGGVPHRVATLALHSASAEATSGRES
jgi:GNAT superfamily N-acetyltransferase